MKSTDYWTCSIDIFAALGYNWICKGNEEQKELKQLAVCSPLSKEVTAHLNGGRLLLFCRFTHAQFSSSKTSYLLVGFS